MEQYKSLPTYRYILILIGMCGIIGVNIGLVTNISGLFYTPIADDFGLLKGTVSLTLTISSIVFAIAGMMSLKIAKKVPIKLLLLSGLATTVIATVLLGLVNNIFVMYILNALRGFAGGIVGLVLVTTVMNNWFVKNSALFTSIAMGFSGLTGAILSPFISSVIQNSGWRSGYFIAAIIMVVFALPSILFLPSINPHDVGLLAYGETNETRKEVFTTSAPKEEKKIDMKLFILVNIFAILSNIIVALPQHFPGIAQAYGLSAVVGTSMLSICMVVNTGGKVALGALVDKFGSKLSILLFIVLTLIGSSLLLIHSGLMMQVSSAFIGCGYAIAAVACVIITRDLFGVDGYGKTYPIISFVAVVTNAIFNTVIGFLYDITGGYTVTILMMIACGILLVVTTLACYGNVEKIKS